MTSKSSLKERLSTRSVVFLVVTIVTVFLILLPYLYEGFQNVEEGLEINVQGIITTVTSSGSEGGFYLGMSDNKVIALSSSHKQVWTYETGASILDLKAKGDLLFASADDRKIYVLDTSGQEERIIETTYRPFVVDGNADVDSIVTGTRFPPLKNRIEVFDVLGERVFTEKVDYGFNNIFITAFNSGFICVTDNAEILSFDESGEIRHKTEIEYNALEVVYDDANGVMVASDIGNNIYVFDRELNLQLKKHFDQKINAIALDVNRDSIVIAMNEGSLVFMDFLGEERYSVDVVQEISKMSINPYSESMYLVKGNHTIYGYNLENLEKYARSQNLIKYHKVALNIAIICFAILVLSLIPVLGDKLILICKNFVLTLLKYRLSYLILLPTIVLLLVFNYFPAISGLIIAFTDYKPGVYMRWVGIDNFVSIINNSYFWVGVGNMFLLLVTDLLKALIPPIIISELIIALRSSRLRYWIRVGLYLPAILPGVAALLVWSSGILGVDGMINELLRSIGMGDLARAWLGDASTAIWGLVLINFPWVGSFIIFYGALINLPESLFDSAKVDGCTWINRIIAIDIPLIMPQIKYVFVLTFIFSIQDFGRVYLTTMGGPGYSTYTPMLELYFNMNRFNNYGMAAGMGLILFIFVFIATLINLRMKTTFEGMD